MGNIEIIGLSGMPEFNTSHNLSEMIFEAALSSAGGIQSGDVIVVTQKVVSKVEGMVRDLLDIEPTSEAEELAAKLGKDPRLVQLILEQSTEIVRTDFERGVLITESIHGFICANAGIDSSNVEGETKVALLPKDSDASARKIVNDIKRITNVESLGVVISDTFGRPWRDGHVNFAIGCAGMSPFIDYKDTIDAVGQVLKVTTICIADELAAASELATGKSLNIPVVVIRGSEFNPENSEYESLLRPKENDLFR
ncbi:MAG: coenzyme F420-0:L-glutamate ligase [Chloroflexota bacterium]|jgi:coenzyme F420-0:L-glutamate ligase/coenzyme F420-1:gamma-L-glutamate ligase|nr:coenzyme F420-0:L-glutamate ligase [Chloroflexota bacterium]MED5409061.1 coenzyme F420-0:L-glutamate ligase [Chloroflexota bacterium]|tara:strand:- start:8114 stop:8875 length:762 start_codon:yes stop_codon:yes gene_type:complete